MRILVTGASGSGTTTLGQAVAADFHAEFLEADDLYWIPTDPPFKQKRGGTERAALLRERLTQPERIVVAGSIMGWDRAMEDSFTLIVFLRAPAQVRVARLRTRELKRFGQVDEAFLTWASEYDAGTMEGRSLARQLAWLEQRHCPILHLSGTEPVAALVSEVRKHVTR